MAVLGENFEEAESEDICGIVLSARKNTDKLGIWTRTGADEELQRRIGKRWRACVTKDGLAGSVKIEYELHSDAQSSGTLKRYAM